MSRKWACGRLLAAVALLAWMGVEISGADAPARRFLIACAVSGTLSDKGLK